MDLWDLMYDLKNKINRGPDTPQTVKSSICKCTSGTIAPDGLFRTSASNSLSCFEEVLKGGKKKKKIGSGGRCNYCTLKAPMDQSYCRWLLCLSQQLFQGLGARSKTTTPPNSCPLSEMKMFVGPAWQEAGGRLAPGTAARPRTGSHAFGTGGCSLQAW